MESRLSCKDTERQVIVELDLEGNHHAGGR